MFSASIALLAEAYRTYGIDFWTAMDMAQFGIGSVEEKPEQGASVPPPAENTAEGIAMLEGMMKGTNFGGKR